MRSPRIKDPCGGYYHIVSRIVDRQRILDQDEKERFRSLLRATESFSGCQTLAYTALDNHWHILLYVPTPQQVSDDELIRRLGFLYDKQVVKSIADSLSEYRTTARTRPPKSCARRIYGACTICPSSPRLSTTLHPILQPPPWAQRDFVGRTLQKPAGRQQRGGAGHRGRLY